MAKKRETYEQMMSKLEEIVAQMEGEELSLEETMKHYEEGVTLCNQLYKVLNEAEGKIRILSEEGETPFETAE